MARPLKYVSGDNALQEMSDADLDRLCYNLRLAYASQLNSSGNGSIYEGSGNTSIGSFTDTIFEAQYNTRPRDQDGNPNNNYPAYPGLYTNTSHGTFTYRQRRSVPSFPSNATLDADGYVYYSSNEVRSANSAAHLYDEILSQTITDMRTGDEVGTYRVSVSSPGSGWVSKDSAWFIDHKYQSGYRTNNTITTSTHRTYQLWLRTSASAPGSEVRPLGLDTSDLKERTIGSTSNLVVNVLLPALTRRMNNGDLLYTVSSSNSGGVNRGEFQDHRRSTQLQFQSFSNPTYFSYTTLVTSGANSGTTEVADRFLILA